MRNMFIVRDDWKIEMPMFEELGGDMGETHYEAMEVFERSFLFHVDFLFPTPSKYDPDEHRKIRMIVGSIEPIIASIRSGVSVESILLQYFAGDSPDGKEGFALVEEVIAGTCKDGHPAYVYVCKNEMRFVDAMVDQSEEELTLGRKLYFDWT